MVLRHLHQLIESIKIIYLILSWQTSLKKNSTASSAFVNHLVPTVLRFQDLSVQVSPSSTCIADLILNYIIHLQIRWPYMAWHEKKTTKWRCLKLPSLLTSFGADLLSNASRKENAGLIVNENIEILLCNNVWKINFPPSIQKKMGFRNLIVSLLFHIQQNTFSPTSSLVPCAVTSAFSQLVECGATYRQNCFSIHG